MSRIDLDERIPRILTCALNANARYTSVNVTFTDGEQKITSLYTSPEYGTGQHFLDNGRHMGETLDDVLSIVQSFEDRGDVETLIKNVEQQKKEVLERLSEYTSRAKDLDICLTKLIKAAK